MAAEIKNEGDIAEAVLGAAIIAKLTARGGGGKVSRINSQDVKKVLQMMRKVSVTSGSASKVQIKLDVGGKAKDKITFLLRLKSDTMTELKSLNDFNVLDRIAQAAASFANSPRTEALSEQAYNNNLNNKIEVSVDGISTNFSDKSDIQVTVDGLRFDRISLKAGKKATGKSLGQVGGATWAAIRRMFADGYNEKSKKFDVGLDLPINNSINEKQYLTLLTEEPNFTTLSKAVTFAYKLADRLFNSVSSSKSAKTIYEFIKHHSTLNDPSVRIVEFHLGKHKVLNPLVLENNLKDVKLRAVTKEKDKWPLFIVYDASAGGVPVSQYSPNVIIGVRPKADTRSLYITHIVEKGSRLNELMDVTGKE